jgi:hypothetical protein
VKRPEKADGGAFSVGLLQGARGQNTQFPGLLPMARPGLEPGTPRFSVVRSGPSEAAKSLEDRRFARMRRRRRTPAICILFDPVQEMVGLHRLLSTGPSRVSGVRAGHYPGGARLPSCGSAGAAARSPRVRAGERRNGHVLSVGGSPASRSPTEKSRSRARNLTARGSKRWSASDVVLPSY